MGVGGQGAGRAGRAGRAAYFIMEQMDCQSQVFWCQVPGAIVREAPTRKKQLNFGFWLKGGGSRRFSKNPK